MLSGPSSRKRAGVTPRSRYADPGVVPVDRAWFYGLDWDLAALTADIRRELQREPDTGDLLLALGFAAETPAGRALRELGVDLDGLHKHDRARPGTSAAHRLSSASSRCARPRSARSNPKSGPPQPYCATKSAASPRHTDRKLKPCEEKCTASFSPAHQTLRKRPPANPNRRTRKPIPPGKTRHAQPCGGGVRAEPGFSFAVARTVAGATRAVDATVCPLVESL